MRLVVDIDGSINAIHVLAEIDKVITNPTTEQYM
jgi:hypothetical protein